MDDGKQAEAAAVADLMRGALLPQLMNVEDDAGKVRTLLLAPKEFGIHSVKNELAEYRDAPERIEGKAELTELSSFIDHAKRFANPGSCMFVDRTRQSPCLLSVYDYHGKDEPRFKLHKARYGFPVSDHWTAWTAQDGKVMGQPDFAAWLEDHLADVAPPDKAGMKAKAFLDLFSCHFASASKLLELSRGLTVHVGQRVANHVNLATGEGSIQFDTAHADEKGAPLKVPGAFLLGIPVFRGGALYEVPARLRFRAAGGSVSWSFQLHRTDVIFDHAISEAVDTFKKEVPAMGVFYGTPEA